MPDRTPETVQFFLDVARRIGSAPPPADAVVTKGNDRTLRALEWLTEAETAIQTAIALEVVHGRAADEPDTPGAQARRSSFTEIGEALGISKQAAALKFRRAKRLFDTMTRDTYPFDPAMNTAERYLEKYAPESAVLASTAEITRLADAVAQNEGITTEQLAELTFGTEHTDLLYQYTRAAEIIVDAQGKWWLHPASERARNRSTDTR